LDVNEFTYVFLAALAAAVALQLWLGMRNVTYVRAHREGVPEAFRGELSLEDHRKAADYTVAKGHLNHVALVFHAGLLLVWTIGGGLELLDRSWRELVTAPLPRGVAVVLSAVIVVALLDLPFSIYRTFRLEERFGFNRTTPWLFVSDLVKGGLLLIAIGAPLIWIILWIMDAAGAYWWFYAWLVWMAFSLIETWAYPRLIAPLFNRFTPLEDPSLEARVRRLAKTCGFGVKDIFVMDGSRRSAHGNAYLTGFGGNKRIVFFDTLVGALEAPEVEAVLAHELGHFKRRHVQKFLVSSALVTLVGWMVLGWLAGEGWFYAGLGVNTPSYYMALILFVMVAPVFTVFMRPLLSALARHFEYEADDFAAEKSDAQALIAALVKLYRDNASTLTPDPVYSAFYHTHPPPPLRVRPLSSRVP
jgi:STE24 endopeptidase